MENPAGIADRLLEVNSRIQNALGKAGRREEKVTLVAVSKTFPAEYLSAAIAAGASDLGESRVQEFEAKKPQVVGQARWHLIGHLQKNKINKALPLFDLIQSVDSYDLAAAISERADGLIEILVQVNSSGEESKFGLEMEIAQEEVLRISELANIKVMGLMTIGRFTDDERLIRASFSPVRKMFEDLKKFEHDKLKMNHLSMGMSGDFELAIDEGSNMVRVGSLIFGARG